MPIGRDKCGPYGGPYLFLENARAAMTTQINIPTTVINQGLKGNGVLLFFERYCPYPSPKRVKSPRPSVY